MAIKQQSSKEDLALFRDSVRDARRLDNDRAPPFRRRTRPVPQKTLEDQALVRQEMLSLEHDPAEIETGEEMLFMRPGLQHGLMRKLRRGQFAIGADLDLHGLTVAPARDALSGFLAECRASNVYCVRIIHGKGRSSPGKKPVLKVKLQAWLQQIDDVLAFCSARPCDGGTGAVYVLLRRSKG